LSFQRLPHTHIYYPHRKETTLLGTTPTTLPDGIPPNQDEFQTIFNVPTWREYEEGRWCVRIYAAEGSQWLTNWAAAETPEQDSERSQNVRFADGVQQIEPVPKMHQPAKASADRRVDELTPEAHDQIRNLALTFQKSNLHESRMSNFAYEPVSMPASRVSHSVFATHRLNSK